MRIRHQRQQLKHLALGLAAAICAAIVLVFAASDGRAAMPFDGEAGTQWWFNPVNWDRSGNANNILPPGDATGGATDTQINLGTAALPGGEGVVFDPANDPSFPPPGTITFPDTFGAQTIRELYISRNTPNTNVLTVKGDLRMNGNVIVGRSSGTRNVPTNGSIVQKGGTFSVASRLDLAQTDTSNNGYGNGAFDYQAGNMEVGIPLGDGLRLSGGTDSNAPDTQVAGAGGIARFIVHNPDSAGHVRLSNLIVAQYRGPQDAVVTAADPDGITHGVGIVEMHYENGGTRPIQIAGNLTLNNGLDEASLGTRSARLDIRLDEPVPVDAEGVPDNLGLMDIDFDAEDLAVGALTGIGSLSRTFSSADGSVNYPEGATVSAVFGSTTYNWMISYQGLITWSDLANSVVTSVAPGTAGIDNDVVLIGLGSIVEPGEDADFDDVNGVEGNDVLLWQQGLGITTGATNANGDADGDGDVDDMDLGIWVSDFGTPVVPAIGAAPEPSTALLCGLASLCGLARRARRRS